MTEQANTGNTKKDLIQVIDWLIELFPNAFFKKGHQIKALKIGIFDDILEFYDRLDTPPCSKKILREALRYYSASPAYLKAQKENAPRIDIYGIEVDLVTEQQAKYAQKSYQDRYLNKREQ